jgi:hypothetical protein
MMGRGDVVAVGVVGVEVEVEALQDDTKRVKVQ